MSEKTRPGILLTAWFVTTIAVGLALSGIYILAPRILENEDRTGHWRFYRLAKQNLAEWERRRWSPDQETRKKFLDRAVEFLEKASRARPESRDYLWLWGFALYNRALMESPLDSVRMDEAIAKIEAVWEQSGENWTKPGLFLAEHYIKTDNDKQAEVILNQLLASHPEDPSVYEPACRLKIRQADSEAVVRILEQKEKNLGLSPADRELLVRSLLRIGKFEQAQEILKRMIETGTESRETRLLLGVALLGTGRLITGFQEIAFHLIRETGLKKRIRLDVFDNPFFPVLAYSLLETSLGEPSR